MIRLPDFLDDIGLNAVRDAMGAYNLGTFSGPKPAKTLTRSDLDRLVSVGIDISSLDEVTQHSDGTLVYKGRRIVLYIRDINVYRGGGASHDDLPKYHVANCRTLDDMRAQNRFGRYVVAANVTGEFSINQIRGKDRVTSTTERLNVCQNCLTHLRFDGFEQGLAISVKRQIRDQFTLTRFFDRYPHDVVSADDAENELTAPLNDYPGEFGRYATAAKQRAGYRCEDCGILLADRHLRRYLHAHHINAIKYDNAPENLRALCIRCHACQPGHGHMRSLKEYKEFQQHVV